MKQLGLFVYMQLVVVMTGNVSFFSRKCRSYN